MSERVNDKPEDSLQVAFNNFIPISTFNKVVEILAVDLIPIWRDNQM